MRNRNDVIDYMDAWDKPFGTKVKFRFKDGMKIGTLVGKFNMRREHRASREFRCMCVKLKGIYYFCSIDEYDHASCLDGSIYYDNFKEQYKHRDDEDIILWDIEFVPEDLEKIRLINLANQI